MHSDLQLFYGLLVLRLGGVDQAEKLVRFKAPWDARQKSLQLGGGFGQISSVVLRNGGLKFTIEDLFLLVLGCGESGTKE
ncbi:MAG TPA: hypothetical protein VE218_07185 [Acidobacteriaceae bacterium]|nr:hypothetical protein [Acidobacteriaceae bacterium]